MTSRLDQPEEREVADEDSEETEDECADKHIETDADDSDDECAHDSLASNLGGTLGCPAGVQEPRGQDDCSEPREGRQVVEVASQGSSPEVAEEDTSGRGLAPVKTEGCPIPCATNGSAHVDSAAAVDPASARSAADRPVASTAAVDPASLRSTVNRSLASTAASSGSVTNSPVASTAAVDPASSRSAVNRSLASTAASSGSAVNEDATPSSSRCLVNMTSVVKNEGSFPLPRTTASPEAPEAAAGSSSSRARYTHQLYSPCKSFQCKLLLFEMKPQILRDVSIVARQHEYTADSSQGFGVSCVTEKEPRLFAILSERVSTSVDQH